MSGPACARGKVETRTLGEGKTPVNGPRKKIARGFCPGQALYVRGTGSKPDPDAATWKQGGVSGPRVSTTRRCKSQSNLQLLCGTPEQKQGRLRPCAGRRGIPRPMLRDGMRSASWAGDARMRRFVARPGGKRPPDQGRDDGGQQPKGGPNASDEAAFGGTIAPPVGVLEP